jgi:hypothetical protein
MRFVCLSVLAVIAIALSACGPERPDLAARISPEARAAPAPRILPLAPVLRQSDALLPRVAASEGRSLTARAADLRRRAAVLRDLPL